MTKPRLDSEQLFELGRRFSAPEGRRELLRARVLRQAVGGVLLSAAAMALPTASAKALPLKAWSVLATCLVIGAGGGVAILLSRETPEPASRVALGQSTQLSAVDPAQELVHSAAQPQTLHEEQLSTQETPGNGLSKANLARAKVAAGAADQLEGAPRSGAAQDLALELSLLRRAQEALSAGNATSALGLLEEHAVRFPATRLVQERRAARVLALCRLNRKEQGEREARAFLSDFPKSPLAARVERACGSAAPPRQQP